MSSDVYETNRQIETRTVYQNSAVKQENRSCWHLQFNASFQCRPSVTARCLWAHRSPARRNMAVIFRVVFRVRCHMFSRRPLKEIRDRRTRLCPRSRLTIGCFGNEETNRQTNRQTDRQTDGRTDGQINGFSVRDPSAVIVRRVRASLEISPNIAHVYDYRPNICK